jgi:hypothetical protein
MSHIRRPSASLVVASIALFIAAGGGAWAAGKATDHPANGARAGSQSASGASGPRGPHGPRGPRGFTGPRGPQGPAGPAGPSDGFVKRALSSVGLPSGTDTVIAQLSLTPDQSYIVTAATELGNGSGNPNSVSCTLLENFNPLGAGSAALPGTNTFAATMTLTGASTGGNVKLSCNADNTAVARNTVITAVKVGTLHTQ